MQNLFSRSPWERAAVIPLRGPILGQVSPNCEPTPEGGQRCANGTYLPPGCAPGSPQAIQGQPTTATFPIVPALAVVGTAAAAYFLLSGQRLGVTEEGALERILAKIEEITTSIKAERAADAWNFSQYLAKSKENLDLLEKERVAGLELARQTQIWETNHRNADQLQAAQATFDSIQAQRINLKLEIDDFRSRVDGNSQNVVTLRQQALEWIDTLPEELREDARKKIDPCFKNPVMQGAFLGQVRLVRR